MVVHFGSQCAMCWVRTRGSEVRFYSFSFLWHFRFIIIRIFRMHIKITHRHKCIYTWKCCVIKIAKVYCNQCSVCRTFWTFIKMFHNNLGEAIHMQIKALRLRAHHSKFNNNNQAIHMRTHELLHEVTAFWIWNKMFIRGRIYFQRPRYQNVMSTNV